MILSLAELLVSCHIAVKCLVNARAQMLYSHSNREGLCLYGVSVLKQHFVGISRAVSYCEKHRRAYYLAPRRAYRDIAVGKMAYAVKPRAVKHSAAKLLYPLKNSVNYTEQKIGTDVRLCGGEYLLRSAEIAKSAKHVADLHVVYSRQKLSVREGSRASCAKLYVRLGVKYAELAEGLVFFTSLRDAVASVYDYRRIAVLSEQKRAEKSRRSHSDDQRRCAHRGASVNYFKLSVLKRGDAVFTVAFRQKSRARRIELRRYRIYKPDVALFSCVNRPFIHAKMKSCRVYPCTLQLACRY